MYVVIPPRKKSKYDPEMNDEDWQDLFIKLSIRLNKIYMETQHTVKISLDINKYVNGY